MLRTGTQESRTSSNITISGHVELRDNARAHFGHTFLTLQQKESCLQHVLSSDARLDKERIQGTAGGLLPESCSWIFSNTDYKQWLEEEHIHVLRITGNPGKGKTMLLCSIIDKLRPSTKLGGNPDGPSLAFFFCQATDMRINTATSVLRGLIFLLASQQESLMSYIQKKCDDGGSEVFEGPNAWEASSETLTSMFKDQDLKKVYLIIDAFDECPEDRDKLLDFVIRNSSSSHIKWIISSRPFIQPGLSVEQREVTTGPQWATLSLEDNIEHVSQAVKTYIDYRVSNLASIQNDDALKCLIRATMEQKANGTFLWVALVVRRLQQTLEWDMLKVVEDTPESLTEMYDQMLKQIQLLTETTREYCKLTLSVVIIAFEPVCLNELLALSGFSEKISGKLEYLEKIVKLCACFLVIRGDIVHIIHLSARDFLCKALEKKVEGQGHVGERNLELEKLSPGGLSDQHYAMLSNSLKVMSRTLRRDMYNLHEPGFPIDHAKPPSLDPLLSVRYSCLHWVDHLIECRLTPKDFQDVEKFLRKNYLHWLEALSLLKGIPVGILSIRELESLLYNYLDQYKYS